MAATSGADAGGNAEGEHSLRLALAQLSATLESTTDGILVTDLERNVLRCNGRFRQMWRLDPELVEAGVEATLALVPERPVDALLTLAEENDARAIVVGTHGEHPFKGALLGSTPHKLLYLSERPVIVVPVVQAD